MLSFWLTHKKPTPESPPPLDLSKSPTHGGLPSRELVERRKQAELLGFKVQGSTAPSSTEFPGISQKEEDAIKEAIRQSTLDKVKEASKEDREIKEAIRQSTLDQVKKKKEEKDLEKAIRQSMEKYGQGGLSGPYRDSSTLTWSPKGLHDELPGGNSESDTHQQLGIGSQSDGDMQERKVANLRAGIAKQEKEIKDIKATMDQFKQNFPDSEKSQFDDFLKELWQTEEGLLLLERKKIREKRINRVGREDIINSVREKINEFSTRNQKARKGMEALFRDNGISDFKQLEKLQKELNDAEEKDLALHAKLRSLQEASHPSEGPSQPMQGKLGEPSGGPSQSQEDAQIMSRVPSPDSMLSQTRPKLASQGPSAGSERTTPPLELRGSGQSPWKQKSTAADHSQSLSTHLLPGGPRGPRPLKPNTQPPSGRAEFPGTNTATDRSQSLPTHLSGGPRAPHRQSRSNTQPPSGRAELPGIKEPEGSQSLSGPGSNASPQIERPSVEPPSGRLSETSQTTFQSRAESFRNTDQFAGPPYTDPFERNIDPFEGDTKDQFAGLQPWYTPTKRAADTTGGQQARRRPTWPGLGERLGKSLTRQAKSTWGALSETVLPPTAEPFQPRLGSYQSRLES